MAKTLVVNNLTEHGLITDVAPFNTPANAWTSARNVSFENGGVVKAGNRTQILTPAVAPVNKTYSKLGKIYYTTQTQILQNTGIKSVNLSHGGGSYSPTEEWFIADLSNVLVFVNPVEVPQMLLPSAAQATDLTGWGWENGMNIYWRTPLIRAYKNFLVAIGMTEGIVDYPQRIRWSDLAVPNQAPVTWDASDTTKSAGFNDLSEARGKLIDALEYKDTFFIYTSEEVFMMSYVGGNDIFSFRKVFNDVSILAKECVCSVNGGHFVVTNSDIIIHNGGSYTSVITNKIKKELFSNISKGDPDRVRVQSYPAKNEVWVCYPSSPTSSLDRAAIFNMDNGTWTYRELPNFTTISYASFPSESDKIIDSQHQIINTDHSLINGVGKDFTKGCLYAVSDTLEFWAIDDGTYGNSTLPSSVSKQYIDFDEWSVEATQHKLVKAVYPQCQGSGTLWISLGVSESPVDAPTWSTAVPFNIGTDRKADFRVTGRYISIKFESFSPNTWSLLSYGIEGAPRGDK